MKVHYPDAYTTGRTFAEPTTAQDYYTNIYPAVVTPTTTGLSTNDISTGQVYANSAYGAYYPYHQTPVSGTLTHHTNALNPLGHMTGETTSPEPKDDKDGTQTYDWMKIRRNPPKTTRKFNEISRKSQVNDPRF